MFFFKCCNINLLATNKPFACKEKEMCVITPTWNANKLWHSSVLWRTQWNAISWIVRWLRITCSIPSRKLCMGVKLHEFLSFSWWTVFFYYYTFSIIEFISKAYIFFLCCIITLIKTSVFSWHHVSLYKNVLKIFIICFYLFTFTFISVEILYFVSVLTTSDWEEAGIHMKFKGILQKAM